MVQLRLILLPSRQAETMARPRKPKKSETLEVRLPHETKSALMDKARTQGRSASDVVRHSIEAYLAEKPKEARSMLITLWKPAAALGAAAVAMWVAVAPAPLHAKPDLKTIFQAVDGDKNGSISLPEFVKHAADPSVIHAYHEGMGDEHKAMAAAAAASAMHGQPPSESTLRSHFTLFDTNGDGIVSFDEFKAVHDKMMAAHSGH